jgi:methylisocitrate lyase
VIFPVSLLRLAMGEVVRSLAVLKDTGSFESLVGRMQTRKELYSTLGYEPGTAWRYPDERRARRGE